MRGSVIYFFMLFVDVIFLEVMFYKTLKGMKYNLWYFV